MRTSTRSVGLFLLIVILGAGVAAADTVTLNPVKDNTLYEPIPHTSG